MSKKKFEGVCPCCENHMKVTEYTCKKCGIKISGNFQKSNFWNLDVIQLKFAEIFLKNRGNIKDVEKELGISYPSVKKLLDGLVQTLKGNGVRENRNPTPKVVFMHEDGLSPMEEGVVFEDAIVSVRESADESAEKDDEEESKNE